MKARSRTISQGSWALLFAVAVWAVGWWCAPSVGVASLGTWIYQDDAVAAILLGAAVSLVILSVLLVTQPTLRRVVWRRHWTLVFLILPMLLFTTLPFRVGGVSASLAGVPTWAYMLMAVVHVTVQQWLTFGWLQTQLQRWLPPFVTIVVTGTAFYAIHAVLLPHKFAPAHWLAALAIFAIGIGCALLRRKTGSVWTSLALHLTFYGVLL